MKMQRASPKMVRQLRLTLDRTQAQMAADFGVSRPTWHRWEWCGADPQVANHMRLYAACPIECRGVLVHTRIAVNPDGTHVLDGFVHARNTENDPRR